MYVVKTIINNFFELHSNFWVKFPIKVLPFYSSNRNGMDNVYVAHNILFKYLVSSARCGANKYKAVYLSKKTKPEETQSILKILKTAQMNQKVLTGKLLVGIKCR